MSIRYILDSYAWLEYLDGSTAGKYVKEILENNECYSSSLSIAEVTIKILRHGRDPKNGYAIMISQSIELPITHAIGYEAGELYIEKRKRIKDIGIVNVLIMTQARKEGLTIVTGNRDHFTGEKNVIFI